MVWANFKNYTKNLATGQVKKEHKFRIEKKVNLFLRQITTILRIFWDYLSNR